MKKCFWVLGLLLILLLESCETTREITITDKETGTMVTTTDLSGLIGIAKMSGKNEEMDKLGEQKIDTSFSLARMADSIEGVNADDRALIRAGNVHLRMDLAEEKFLFRVELPFSKTEQIGRLDQLSSTMMQSAMKRIMAQTGGGDLPVGGDNEIPSGSFDAYFTTIYTGSVIEKKLNKEKYASLSDDEAMSALKEMSGAGLGNNTIIINLPRPAKKAEGKNLTISEDRKKITISGGLEEFFDDAASLEFRIEY